MERKVYYLKFVLPIFNRQLDASYRVALLLLSIRVYELKGLSQNFFVGEAETKNPFAASIAL